MLVEQVGLQGQPILRQRFAGAGTECRIGRDLGCDIVVDDEHAAPQHALLTLLEDGRVNVRDLGTRNGTRVDGKLVPADAGVNIEQGEIIVGRTRLRIRTRHVPIGTERVFRREFVRRHRTLLATAGVLACVAFGGFLQWLDAPSSMLRSVTKGGLVALGADRAVVRPLGADDEAEPRQLARPAPRDDRLDRRGVVRLGLLAGRPRCRSPRSGRRSSRSALPPSGWRHWSRCTCTCARQPNTGAAWRSRSPAPRLS